MDYKEFMSYMDANGTSHKDAITGLQNYVQEFPYFQTAQALLAKALREQEHVRFDKQLKIAAAYCGDRKSLYALIHHKPSSIFIEAGESSPFISAPISSVSLQEENPFTETPVFEESKNPFTEIQQETTPVFETIVSAPNEGKNFPIFSEEEEIKTEFAPPISSGDPHDIIRERLKEILNKKESTDEEVISSPIENTIVKEEIASPSFVEKIVESLKEVHDEVVNTTEVSQTSENIPASIENRTEEIIQLIAKESEHRKDDVDRGELEYALESTIIASLENLPLLDETKEAKEESVKTERSSAMTFFDWLKEKQVDQFGKVEEIHAYDKGTETEKADSSFESSVEITALEKAVNVEKQPIIVPPTVVRIPEVENLIDKFIATEPRIVPSKTEFYSPAKQAQKSLIEHEDLVSETLARIYRLQGAFLKARSAYQKLILLHPEKKAYFAALIEEIDNQYNNPDKQDL